MLKGSLLLITLFGSVVVGILLLISSIGTFREEIAPEYLEISRRSLTVSQPDLEQLSNKLVNIDRVLEELLSQQSLEKAEAASDPATVVFAEELSSVLVRKLSEFDNRLEQIDGIERKLSEIAEYREENQILRSVLEDQRISLAELAKKEQPTRRDVEDMLNDLSASSVYGPILSEERNNESPEFRTTSPPRPENFKEIQFLAPKTTVADVRTGSTQFLVDDETTTTADIGAFSIAGGVPMSFSVELSGDFTWVDESVIQGCLSEDLSAKEVHDNFLVFDLSTEQGQIVVSDTCYISVSATGVEPITEGVLTATVASEVSELAQTTSYSIGTIERNGTTVEIPYLTTFEDYNQRITIVNRADTDSGDYYITFSDGEDSDTIEQLSLRPGAAVTIAPDKLRNADIVTISTTNSEADLVAELLD